MKRIVLGLSIFAAACLAVLVALLIVAEWLLTRTYAMFSSDSPTAKQIEESQWIGRTATSLMISCGPLAAAVLLAVVAILVVLAARWELRRARAR